MFIRARLLTALLGLGALALSAPVGFAQTTNVFPGTTIVPRLTGAGATSQSNLLERLRHLPPTAGFEARTFTAPGRAGATMRYLLFRPKDTDTNQSLPLVLSLHGGGPRRKFEDLLEPYAPGFDYGLGRFVAEETQRAHPSLVLAPWSNQRGWDEENQRLVLGVIEALRREFAIDGRRIYITGQSMGGFGTWSMITAHPETFAAAVPICGGGTPRDAARARNAPVWALHGSGDGVVPVAQSRDMITALQKSGAKPIYWEYKDATHAETAERAYCEPELIEWLFAQSRTDGKNSKSQNPTSAGTK